MLKVSFHCPFPRGNTWMNLIQYLCTGEVLVTLLFCGEKNHLWRCRYSLNALMPVRRDLQHCYWPVQCVSQYCLVFLPALVLQTRLEWEMIFETVDYTLLICFVLKPDLCAYTMVILSHFQEGWTMSSLVQSWDVIKWLKAIKHFLKGTLALSSWKYYMWLGNGLLIEKEICLFHNV